MTQLHAERNLFHALDTYMDNSTSIQNMQQVAHNLNMQTSVTPTIHARFCSMLSESQNDNIRKTLDLLEYLTVFSSSKLAQIVNDDKFMEYISQALMENELLDRVLNLLKFWSEEYADSKQDIELVFVLLENLEQIDIHIPPTYDSPFKNMAAGPMNTQVHENPAPPVAQGLVSSRMSELILKAKEVRDEAKQLLEGRDPISALSGPNNTKINHLLAQILRVCQEFDSLKNVELNPEVRRSIENVIEELNSYRIKLHERLNSNAATTAYSQNDDDDSYKIVISEVEQSKLPAAEDSEAASSRILEMDELLNYKVQPCLQAVYCKKIPEYDAEADEDDELNEIQCEGWHSSANRKRVVYDDSGQMTYSYKECEFKDNCQLANICKESHNFYEKMFHPHYYKKERCKNVRNCQNGRYCPYYHTMQEMDDWQKTLKQYFEGTNESNEEGMEEEDNTSTRDIQTTKSQEFDSYPEDENLEPTKQSRYSKFDDPNQSSTLTNQYKGIHNLSGFSKSRNVLQNNPGPFFSKSGPLEEPKGNLHSKLVIRKKYDDPTILSQFFQKSQLFSGLPFFVYYPASTNKK